MSTFAYPATEDALHEVQHLVAIIRGTEPMEKRQFGKSLWVTQGYVQSWVLGEPGALKALASAESLEGTAMLSPKAAVEALEDLIDPKFQASGFFDGAKSIIMQQLLLTLITWATEWFQEGGFEKLLKLIQDSLSSDQATPATE